GTIVRLYALRGTEPADRLDPLGSLKCWWAIALAGAAALLLGRGGVVLLLVLISIQAWREYLKLTPAASADRTTLVLAQALILLNGWWLWRGRWDVFVLWLPLTAVLLPALSLALQGRTQGFVNT